MSLYIVKTRQKGSVFGNIEVFWVENGDFELDLLVFRHLCLVKDSYYVLIDQRKLGLSK